MAFGWLLIPNSQFFHEKNENLIQTRVVRIIWDNTCNTHDITHIGIYSAHIKSSIPINNWIQLLGMILILGELIKFLIFFSWLIIPLSLLMLKEVIDPQFWTAYLPKSHEFQSKSRRQVGQTVPSNPAHQKKYDHWTIQYNGLLQGGLQV